jgi:hypothetical protein
MLSAVLTVELQKAPKKTLTPLLHAFDLVQAADGSLVLANNQSGRSFKLPRSFDRGYNFPWNLVLGLGNFDVASAELTMDGDVVFTASNAHSDCVENMVEAFSLLLPKAPG